MPSIVMANLQKIFEHRILFSLIKNKCKYFALKLIIITDGNCYAVIISRLFHYFVKTK